MPKAAPKPCNHPGCGVVVRDGSSRCAQHKRVEARALDARRGSSAERGYGGPWQKARDGFLRSHPLCVRHEQRGEKVGADVVDHIVPHRLKQAKDSQDPVRIAKARELFWDQGNWQALCKDCHDSKTEAEDGAFGRPGGRQARR